MDNYLKDMLDNIPSNVEKKLQHTGHLTKEKVMCSNRIWGANVILIINP